MDNLLLYYADIQGKLIFSIRVSLLINLVILTLISIFWWESKKSKDVIRKIFNRLMILAIILTTIHILLPSADFTLYIHNLMKGL